MQQNFQEVLVACVESRNSSDPADLLACPSRTAQIWKAAGIRIDELFKSPGLATVHGLPNFSVAVHKPVFFSSKNQMSSVRELATGEFVATHFQSFAVLMGLLPFPIRTHVQAASAGLDKGSVVQRPHRGPDVTETAAEAI